MLGISTCWWNGKGMPGDEIVDDALAMGFHGVELEYRMTHAVFQQMKPRLTKDLSVLSVHNFFPRPDVPGAREGSGDFFLLSSIDPDERRSAVKYSIRTIQHADDLEAGKVVMHLGRVNMPAHFEKFSALFRNQKVGTPEGAAFLKTQRRIRNRLRGKHMDAVLFSLEQLNREAQKHHVMLAIENRYYFREIPDFEEIGMILEKFRGGNLRYWHDVGHAAVQEHLGICRQRELLTAYADALIGIHLHDIKGLDDHFAPGQGEIRFEEITPFFKPHMTRILEIHPKVTKEALKKIPPIGE